MSSGDVIIEWDRDKLESFKRTYAANKNRGVFTWDGHEFLTAYAKYLIEYLETKLERYR